MSAPRKLSELEQEILRFAQEYGPQIDFGGRGANRRKAKLAEALCTEGFLAGSYRSASITPLGIRALDASRRMMPPC